MPLAEAFSNGVGIIFAIKDARDKRRRFREEAESARALADKIGSVAGAQLTESPIAVIDKPLLDSPAEESTTVDIVSGTSQTKAEGKACLACSSDHWAGVASMLTESIRFARDGGIQHPEVIKRIAHAEEEIAALEREDGSPDTLSQLPDDEHALMNEVLINCRTLRHIIWDINTVEALEDAATKAQEFHIDLKSRALKLSMARMTPEKQEEIKTRAREAITQATEGE